ncbi:MAG: hypothetical protein AAF108_07830, partial [Planctomycetota bacterium]
ELLESRAHDPAGGGALPSHRLSWPGGSEFFFSEHAAAERAAALGLELGDAGDGATVRELHENAELARVIDELGGLGLSIDDYLLVREESITGQKLPAKYAWSTGGDAESDAPPEGGAPEGVDDESATPTSARTTRSGERLYEAANLREIITALHEIGRRGYEVKRFKGLGEMNAEQLWDTTMDPERRVLLRVTWDMAGRAEYLFSTLMGEQVEPRRKFIEDHALEVKNLDI